MPIRLKALYSRRYKDKQQQDKTHWITIGLGEMHDRGIDLSLDALPPTNRFILRDADAPPGSPSGGFGSAMRMRIMCPSASDPQGMECGSAWVSDKGVDCELYVLPVPYFDQVKKGFTYKLGLREGGPQPQRVAARVQHRDQLRPQPPAFGGSAAVDRGPEPPSYSDADDSLPF